MAISQTASTTTAGPQTQSEQPNTKLPATLSVHLRTDDLETPLDERQVVSAAAVLESDLTPADYWNYVVQVDHVDEDRAHLLFVRAPAAGAAACRTATWGSRSSLSWAGDSAKADYTVFEHGNGRIESPCGGAW